MEEKLNLNSSQEYIKDLLDKANQNYNKNHIKEAFKLFEAALKKDENYPDTYLFKGEAHIGMFEFEEAEACLKKYLCFFPNSERAYLNLFEIYYESGRFKDALNSCDKLLTLDSKNSEFHYKKALLLSSMGKVDSALKAYNMCLKLSPNSYEALCSKAELLNNIGKSLEALKLYSKAIEVNNSKSDAYLEKALILSSLNKNKEALAFAKKAYEINPKDEWCKCNYTLIKSMGSF